MEKNAKDFFAALSIDPEKLREFVASPSDSVNASGLPEEIRKAIVENDRQALERELGAMAAFSNTDYHGLETGSELSSLNLAYRGGAELPDDLSREFSVVPRTVAKKGSLYVVGTGIRIVGQLTAESAARIKTADRVLYVVNDPVAKEAIQSLNPQGASSLADCYVEGEPRTTAYRRMVDRVMESVRSGGATCMVSYGHPGVFALPTHAAIQQARREGYDAFMLPAISAVDCLYADLGVDPAATGCVNYEASDFLLRRRVIDPSSSVILWQVGVTGESIYRTSPQVPPPALSLLVEKLISIHKYTSDHECILYEAAPLPGFEPVRASLKLCDLPTASAITPNSTLYIPPVRPCEVDLEMAERLKALTGPNVTQPSAATRGSKAGTEPKRRAKGSAKKRMKRR